MSQNDGDSHAYLPAIPRLVRSADRLRAEKYAYNAAMRLTLAICANNAWECHWARSIVTCEPCLAQVL